MLRRCSRSSDDLGRLQRVLLNWTKSGRLGRGIDQAGYFECGVRRSGFDVPLTSRVF